MSTASLTLDGGTPEAACRCRSADSGGHVRVYYACPSGGGRVRQTVYAGGQTTAAPGTTWDETDAKRVHDGTASGTDRVFAATESGGSWTSRPAAPGAPADRLATRRDTGGGDVLHRPGPAHRTLDYARR